MAARTRIQDIPVRQVFLHLENPRHKELSDEEQTIAALCLREDVVPIARDIVSLGLNPLENFAVFPTTQSNSQRRPTYFMAEGNRRLCALKLLNDPDLAPPKLRKTFVELAQRWTPIKLLPCTVFSKFDDVRIWLERTHNGANGGIGRKQWNAEQKTRFDGENKNKLAQDILDYAQETQFVTADQRRRKITTVQRFVSNPVLREALGICVSEKGEIARTREQRHFNGMLKKFVDDLVTGTDVNSRMNKREIEEYARKLSNLPAASEPRIAAEPLRANTDGKKAGASTRRKPRRPASATLIRHEPAIKAALQSLKNDKLDRLYYSICSIELDPHAPLVAIGVWAFFETLTSCAGRTESISFESFFSKDRLNKFGLGNNNLALREAVGRIAGFGNTSKHHPTSATFNGDQLNNDVTTLKELILKSIEEAVSKMN